MESGEPSSPNGNISPINGSVSNLADNGKASSSKSAHKTQPFYQIALVIIPAQLAHTVWEPLSISTCRVDENTTERQEREQQASASYEKYAGGGGILIVIMDEFLDEAEFLLSIF
jgi:26S proteasome regulatory subunit N2